MLIVKTNKYRHSYKHDAADDIYKQVNDAIEEFMSNGYKLSHINVVFDESGSSYYTTYMATAYILMFKDIEQEKVMDGSILNNNTSTF